MSYKSILVPAISEDAFDIAMTSAIEFSRRFDSHVLAAHVRMPFDLYPPAVHYPLEVDTWATARDAHEEGVKALEKALRNRFTDIAAKAKVTDLPYNEAIDLKRETVSWQSFSGAIPEVLTRRARLSDITVLPNIVQKIRAQDPDIRERFLSETGRPVLLLPEKGLSVLPRSAVIGWNGSLESTRAVSNSVPLLKRMKKITILTVGTLGEYVPKASLAAEYLSAHDIHVTCQEVEGVSISAGEKLVKATKELKADILITGAYSRNKWREVLFGGTTQYLLKKADIPVLMAH
jgi:nucleotide-binding universal stress UspA family protein